MGAERRGGRARRPPAGVTGRGAALRRTPEAYQLDHLYRTAPVGLCLLDRDLRYVRINERLAEIHGRPAAEHIGRRVREVIPHLAEAVEPSLRRVLATGKPELDVEVQGTTAAEPDRIRTWLVSYYPIRSPKGKVSGLSIAVREVTERQRAEEALAERLRFETLLAELSAAFVNVPADEVDREIERWLRRMVEFLGIERSILFQFTAEEGDFRITHSYAKAGFTPALPVVPREEGPWHVKKMLAGETVVISRLDDFPADAARDKETARRFGVKSAVMVPLMVSGTAIGAMTFDALRRERSWPDDVVRRFRLVGEVFANALARKRAHAEREELLRFEDLVARLSATLIHVPAHAVDKVIEEALRLTTEFLGVDRAAVYDFSEDRTSYRAAHSFARPGVPRAPTMFPSDQFPWFVERVLSGQSVAVGRSRDLADEAQRERDYLASAGIKAFAAVPLAVGGSILGAVGWAALRAGREWPEALVQRMRLVGEVFASALARQRAEEALRQSEERLRLLLETTRAVAWEADARTWQFTYVGPQAAALLGYPLEDWYQKDFWTAHLHPDDREATVAFCLEASRERTDYEFDYRMVSAGGQSVWIHNIVSVEKDEEGPRVLRGFLLDISEQKRLEERARRQREELTHVARVATMGELAASLAHELNQPLGAILSNAEAAEMLLGTDPPALEEVRAILADIVKDDRRAGDVIRRMRGLLRKEELESRPQDLNDLIRDVARLMDPEAHIRRVLVSLALDPGLPPVRGDRVHLQQVILNLMLNGMEAMGKLSPAERILIVRTLKVSAETVEVAVVDRGVGIPADGLSRVFEPFYSTKPSGMGMGLSIVRSIVEAHGGRVWAEKNSQRGATVRFSLPAARENIVTAGESAPRGQDGRR